MKGVSTAAEYGANKAAVGSAMAGNTVHKGRNGFRGMAKGLRRFFSAEAKADRAETAALEKWERTGKEPKRALKEAKRLRALADAQH